MKLSHRRLKSIILKMGSSQPLNAPLVDRSVMLDFVGDWGQATFHKILSWLTQQFCDRAGPKSRTRIWSIRGGGSECIPMVHDGEADLCVATPANLMPAALKGEGIFAQYGPMPHLRALAVLPQRDRMVLVVHPSLNVHSFAEIRSKKPALKLSTCPDDGTSFIGYIAMALLVAHGLDEATLQSWGGHLVLEKRPESCINATVDGKANALLQEAYMLPGWNQLVEKEGWIPIPVEQEVLDKLSKVQGKSGFESAPVATAHWNTKSDFPALEFSDFLLVVRDDMPDDVAALLTWCLINTRQGFERQFKHMPPEKCALTYPMQPAEMAKTSIELHPGARKVYQEAGYL